MQLEVIGINDRLGDTITCGTGPGTGPRTGPVPGPVLGPVLGLVRTGFFLGLVSRTSAGTSPGTSPATLGLVPGPVPGPAVWSSVRDQVLVRPLVLGPNSNCCAATSNRSRHVSGLAPRTLDRVPGRHSVIDVLVVVEDPWIYSARESNTSSQTAPDWDQPGQGPKSRSLPATGPGQLREGQFQGDPGRGDCSRPTRSDLGASRPKR